MVVMYKQIIVVRSDVDMGKGKMAAQVAHASMGASMITPKDVLKKWNASGAKKVVLKASSEEELNEIQKFAKRESLPSFLVKDAGKTQLESGTVTALAVGPGKEEKIDKITGNLKLL